jgi:hypothetical protein
MKNLLTGLCLPLLFCALTAPAAILYDNGPIKGVADALFIQQGSQATNSFILSSNANVTGITFGTWTLSGETVTAVDWSITADAFGLPIYSGTAAVSSAFQFKNTLFFPPNYDLDISSFSVPNLALSAGAYWLQLENAVASGGGNTFWDQNGRSSSAFYNSKAFDGVITRSAVPSSPFQILGDASGASGVPEPNSLALGGSGFLLLAAGALRRKLNR